VGGYVFFTQDKSTNYLKEKITPNKLPTGIPILSRFSKSNNRSSLKKKWEVDENLFTILIMGGEKGLGPIKDTILAFKKISLPVQTCKYSANPVSLRAK